jgi:hypothetical protein
MNMNRENIIHTALEKLYKTNGIKATWKETVRGDFDGIITINRKGKKLVFDVVVKNELRYHQLHAIFNNRKRNGKPVMIIARKIFATIKEELRENGLAYLEANGNVYINFGDTLIWLDGNKPLEDEKAKADRAFTKTGLKVLLLYLTDATWLNRPYRQVAEHAGVALGAIPDIMATLKKSGYLIRVNNKMKLVYKDEIINKWVEAYEEKLKPNIKLGNFMLDSRYEQDWKQIDWIGEQALWGGEPAANLLTNYLNPQQFTLYTTQNIKGMIRNYHLLPHDDGQVKVYEKFWKFPDNTQKTAPPLIVYADLLHTNDSRCIETARIIYKQYLRGLAESI